MNLDKGVQVVQEKIKIQSMDFSINKHLDLSSIIIPFSLNVTKCKGILEIKIPKRGNQSIS